MTRETRQQVLRRADLEGGRSAIANEATDLIRLFYKTADNAKTPSNTLSEFFAEDFLDHNRSAMAPAEVSDRNVALNLFAELTTGFPDAIHELEILEGIGADRAMVYWTFSGTHSGSFFGAPPSGKQVSINGVDVFRVNGGKFVEQWHVEELMSLAQQIAAK